MSEETLGVAEETQSVDSPATESTEIQSTEQTTADAQDGSNKTEVKPQPFHEHPRFKELISEKNELKQKLSQMERVLQERDQPRQPSPEDLALEELKSLGVEEAAAKKVLNSVKLVSNSYADQRIKSLEQASVQREMNSWVDDFSKSHEDFKNLEPQMYEVLKSLPENTQALVASDPMGVQLLYDHVKMQNVSEELNKARKDGANEAYKNKQTKTSLTPTPGGSKNPPGALTRKSIDKMPLAEYKKRRDEIWAALKDGSIGEV